MSKFLQILGSCILVFGIIGSIILAMKLGVKTEVKEADAISKYLGTYVEYVETRDTGLTVGILVGGSLSSVIIFAIMQGISNVLDKLEYQDKKLIELETMLENQKSNP